MAEYALMDSEVDSFSRGYGWYGTFGYRVTDWIMPHLTHAVSGNDKFTGATGVTEDDMQETFGFGLVFNIENNVNIKAEVQTLRVFGGSGRFTTDPGDDVTMGSLAANFVF
jgi:hypothetical protein